MNSMAKRLPTLVALVTLAAAVLAGCGDDTPYVPARGQTLRLRLDEYRILPARITVPAGRVDIVARDVGRLTHNVAIVQFDRPLGEDEEKQCARA
jgi:hypothetical protein